MEMHQIRYFLAVAQTLNFTRAAEQCNVSQPALTRAIQQLEDELAGPLIRREGKLSHLTDLGQRMLPLMQRCYQSALSAKSLATSMRKGAAASLALALSPTVDIGLLVSPLVELQRAFPAMQLNLYRGNAEAVAERLKKGEVDLALAGPLQQDWDRLDTWALFQDPFAIVAHRSHPLGARNKIEAGDVKGVPVLLNPDCEYAKHTSQHLNQLNIEIGRGHQIRSQHDLIALLEGNLGIGILPRSTSIRHDTLQQIPIAGFDFNREVFLYGVAGRQRSTVADALIKLLRARDWTQVLN
ncbi:MAG: LysR family transcriptional regulator [Hyphomicrobiaceae bacterium]